MRTTIRSLATILAIALISSLAVEVSSAAEVYVAPQGNDGNPGTKDQPFKTLEKARDELRSSDGPDRVIIRGGIYRLSDTFELDQRDSNTTFVAAPGESVRIIGGDAIPTSAVKPVSAPAILNRIISTEARSKVRQIDLKALGITQYGELGPRGFGRAYLPAPMELFIDARPQTVARWPNEGEEHIPMGKVIDPGSIPRKGDFSMRPGTFNYDVKRPEQWTQAEDVYISGVFGVQWADDTVKLAKIDTKEGTFTSTIPHLYGFIRKGDFCKWYALNLLEEIDVPGEYHIDQSTGILYFYPPEGFSSESEILVSVLDKPMVAIENAESIRFEDITFEVTRDSAIYIEGGKGNEVVGCTLRNIGSLAIQMGQGAKPFPDGLHDNCGKTADGKDGEPASRIMGNWQAYIYKYSAWNREAGTEHKIIGCDIYDTGAGGIMLGGGDRKTLTPGGNMVKNCDIHRVNRWDRTYKAPVNVDGVGNIIVHNHLHHSTGSAVYLHGNDHVVEYNEIDHVLTDTGDMGAIYMGRDPSEVGNSFSYNFFHNINAKGVVVIYLDDDSVDGAAVIGNVFFTPSCAKVININGGGNRLIRNNIFIDCKRPIGTPKGDPTGKVRNQLENHPRARKHVDITKPPYSTKYPDLFAIYEGRLNVVTSEEGNFITTKDDPQFVDAANMNFKLKDDAKVFTEIEGFEPIPFEKMGLLDDRSLQP